MEQLGYLPQIVILLSAAILVVAIFKKLNLSPVLGYLVAGAIIGEHGLQYVNSKELHIVAEVGIVFLLFAIGLELTIDRLMAMRKHVFGFGSAQVVITSTAIGIFCMIIGMSPEASIIVGGSLGLSSTAIVLRVIADSNAQSTQVGRLALANLLLQDLAVVPLLVLVPLLAAKEGSLWFTMGTATIKAAIALVVIFFLGRLIIRPLFNSIASIKSSELFVAATLFVILGSSLATKAMDLSLAMGAFVAGLLVAETQHQNRVEDNIMPFKGLLMGLFFMTVGMTINPNIIINKLYIIILASAALIFAKAAIIITLARLFKFGWGAAIHAGLLLAQGSEFAFILFGLASQSNIALIEPQTAQVLLTIVTVSMALTPALSKIGELVCKRTDSHISNDDSLLPSTSDLNRHVVIAGFGRVGEMVARLLSAQKISYVVVEADAKRAKKGREKGFPVHHGDASKLYALKAVGIERAKATIITIDQNVYLKKTISVIHKSYPDIPIVVRSVDMRNLKSLEKVGATIVVPEKYEAGLQMAGALLKAIGMTEYEVSRLKNQFRAGDYKNAKEIMPESSS